METVFGTTAPVTNNSEQEDYDALRHLGEESRTYRRANYQTPSQKQTEASEREVPPNVHVSIDSMHVQVVNNFNCGSSRLELTDDAMYGLYDAFLDLLESSRTCETPDAWPSNEDQDDEGPDSSDESGASPAD